MPRKRVSEDAVAIHGLQAIQDALGHIDAEVAEELKRRIKAIGDTVALVAASKAPRRTGELQHSIKSTVGSRSASVYSTAIYGGAVNFGAFPHAGKDARGPHIKRANASHYMERAVTETSPWVESETQGLLDWLLTKFEE